jgi:Rod binding domain-containing protein
MHAAITLPAPGLSPLDMLTRPTAAPSKISATTRAKAHAAAQDFEAVFLNTMFQQMTTGLTGDGPFGGSGATGVWRSMLTDQYSRHLAKAGGIGLADHIYRALIARQEAAQ